MNDLFLENPLALDLPSFDPASFSETHTTQPIGEKFLVFCWGEELFAIASKQVAEAAPTLAVTVLPNVPDWLVGVANLRGEIISVIDLPVILKKQISAPAPKPKFIILRSNVFESGVAFTADRIYEIVTLPPDEIQLNENKKSASIYAKAVYKSQTLNLIDTEKLFASLKF